MNVTAFYDVKRDRGSDPDAVKPGRSFRVDLEN
jgi:hypothetical protein